MTTHLSRLRIRFEPLLRRGFHLYWRFARGMTLGGGVEVGETFLEALTRELFEEGRIQLSAEPELHGVFLNSHVSPRDHVAVFVIKRFTQDRPPTPNSEIVETGFFARDALPEGTTLGTLSRLREVLDGVKVIPTWRPEQPAQAGSL